MPADRSGYPAAERLELVEEIHGHLVADPYRWLEDPDDPRTRRWCAQQDELFARWQSRWLGDEAAGRLRRRLAALADAGSVSVPEWRGERAFFTRRGPGQEHAALRTAGPDGAERVLIDPAALDPSGSTTLDAWCPSPEGTLLAYLISEGDGRWLWVELDWGPVRTDWYLADLAASGIEAPRFTAFQEGVDAITAPRTGPDGRIYVLTDRDAPNRRLCVADPDRLGYEHWHDVLPEDPEAVLRSYAILDGGPPGRRLLLALRSRHALSELTLHELASGELAAPVPLPGRGTVTDLTAPDGGACAWFRYTDFLTPPSVCKFDSRNGRAAVWAPPPGEIEAGTAQVRHVSYASADGTCVRMFILSPAGEPDRPRPAILYGYGSFGSSRTPDFSPLRLAWVEAGGVYAIANVRGGGEEGRAWHRAGMREHKQHGVDDLHAAGDYLVAQGWTTRARLGLHGGSAGGLLVAAALTQRPDACAAVLCSAPVLDLVRYERFPPAALWAREYGSAGDPEELAWLLGLSPYHHVRPGAAYPATLFTVFEADARVNPLHARKLAAALQHATAAPPDDRPVLLRREHNVGHVARAVSRSIPLWLDQLCFFASQLGLGAGRDLPAR